MEDKKVVDLFSWFLFESTGDSEDIFELNVASEDAKMDVEEDDAHSCCCDFMVFDDLGDTHDEDYHIVDDDDGGDDYFDDDDDGDDEDDDDDEEEEVSSRGKSRQHKKLRVSDDSISTTMELMNEMEKSRLFWEACLAS